MINHKHRLSSFKTMVDLDIQYLNNILTRMKLHHPLIINDFCKFYRTILSNLEFLDINLLKIYSECFVYAYFNIDISKVDIKLVNINIMKAGIKQCNNFLKSIENQPDIILNDSQKPEDTNTTVNLYSILE